MSLGANIVNVILILRLRYNHIKLYFIWVNIRVNQNNEYKEIFKIIADLM